MKVVKIILEDGTTYECKPIDYTKGSVCNQCDLHTDDEKCRSVSCRDVIYKQVDNRCE